MKNNFLILMLLGFSSIMFTSCNKENMDTTSPEDKDVTTIVDEVNTTVVCDDQLVLGSDQLNISEEGKAMLYKATCSLNATVPTYDYNYIVYAKSFDANGWGPVGPDVNVDGIPGFTFGSDGAPVVGDVLTQHNADTNEAVIFENAATQGESWILGASTTITITEAGSNVGESIGGTIDGTLISRDNAGVSLPLTGTFCVSIEEVCE